MLPFPVQFRAGVAVSEQVIYAVKKAVISGILRPGDKFPSVRVLSQELKINPNTAHRVIAELTHLRLLDVHPGIGTVIGTIPHATQEQRTNLLGEEMERLIVEAKKLKLTKDDVLLAVKTHWEQLSKPATSTQ